MIGGAGYISADVERIQEGVHVQRAGMAIFALMTLAFPRHSLAVEPGIAAQIVKAQPKAHDVDSGRVYRYITDVTGKTVRIVGGRFYTNPQKSLDFPGRSEAGNDIDR